MVTPLCETRWPPRAPLPLEGLHDPPSAATGRAGSSSARSAKSVMRLNLLIHDVSRYAPFGGIKQQYELANRLTTRGHDVAVYHSLNFNRHVLKHPRSLGGLVRYNLKGPETIEWFTTSGRSALSFPAVD